MDKPLQNPLTTEHLDLMNQVGRSCAVCLDNLKRLQDSGFDVTPITQEVSGNQFKAAGIKRNFFPDQP